MKARLVLTTLQNLKNELGFEPTQAHICKALGLKKATLSARLKRDNDFPEEEIKKLEEVWAIEIPRLNDEIILNYYPDVIASCGNGAFEMSQDFVSYSVPQKLLPALKSTNTYSMCKAKGNSMYPRIWDGDFVIIEHSEELKIENGELYIFCYDDQIYLKRLTKNINQIVVESENPEFPTQYIEKEEINNVHLIGHVVCWGKKNDKILGKGI